MLVEICVLKRGSYLPIKMPSLTTGAVEVLGWLGLLDAVLLLAYFFNILSMLSAELFDLRPVASPLAPCCWLMDAFELDEASCELDPLLWVEFLWLFMPKSRWNPLRLGAWDTWLLLELFCCLGWVVGVSIGGVGEPLIAAVELFKDGRFSKFQLFSPESMLLTAVFFW